MDAGSKPEKDIKDVVKSLKIDPPSKASSANMSGPKDGSTSDATSCISSGSIRESEVDQAALMGEQGLQYYGYCYPGFNSPYGDWSGGQSYFVGIDGLEVQPMAIQADNGSLLYYLPGFQPGYMPPYNPVLPGPMIGVDGQYLGQESYYTSPIYQQPLASPGIYPQSVAYGPELFQAYPWDPSLLYADVYQGNGIGASPTTASPKSSFSSKSHTFSSSKPLLPPKSNTSETKGSLKLDPLQIPALSKTSLKLENKAAGAVLSQGYFPIDKIPQKTHQGKGERLYTNSQINMKENGRSWVGTEKMKFRSKFQGPGSDSTNEQNCGPRTNNAKDSWITGVGPVGVLDAGKNEKSGISISAIRKDMYNLPDFPTKYDHALFFVIKSYSEDDIHKSIKYNVWASTPNGNKRLDNAFQAAQEKVVEQSSKCPVFLFFSVNASGQFCGVAEMIGRVDFNKNMDFWQQDKWNGFFPVKWHIIKDIPNPQFRHIILENNENKPVTNSRDTQEVKFPQGTEMLNIFKNYSSKTSILDDFDFYESRQKAMQDKRSKQPPNSEHPSPKTGGPAKVMDAGDLEPIASGFQSLELEDGKSKEELPDVVEAKE